MELGARTHGGVSTGWYCSNCVEIVCFHGRNFEISKIIDPTSLAPRHSFILKSWTHNIPNEGLLRNVFQTTKKRFPNSLITNNMFNIASLPVPVRCRNFSMSGHRWGVLTIMLFMRKVGKTFSVGLENVLG